MSLIDKLKLGIWNDIPKNPKSNDLNKALYSSWFSPFIPITNTRNLTSDIVSGYMDNDTVYSIINKIADTAANIPLKLVDKN